MKTTTIYLRKAYICFFLSSSCIELGAMNANRSQGSIDEQLGDMFSRHRKGDHNPQKIRNLKQGFSQRLYPLLKEVYRPSKLKRILDDMNPGIQDKRLFLSLQWAYEQGREEDEQQISLLFNEDIDSHLFSMFKISGGKQSYQSENLQEEILKIIGSQTTSINNELLQKSDLFRKIAHKPKTIPLLKLLEWSYHLSKNESATIDNQEPPIPPNIKTDINGFEDLSSHTKKKTINTKKKTIDKTKIKRKNKTPRLKPIQEEEGNRKIAHSLKTPLKPKK